VKIKLGDTYNQGICYQARHQVGCPYMIQQLCYDGLLNALQYTEAHHFLNPSSFSYTLGNLLPRNSAFLL